MANTLSQVLCYWTKSNHDGVRTLRRTVWEKVFLSQRTARKGFFIYEQGEGPACENGQKLCTSARSPRSPQNSEFRKAAAASPAPCSGTWVCREQEETDIWDRAPGETDRLTGTDRAWHVVHGDGQRDGQTARHGQPLGPWFQSRPENLPTWVTPVLLQQLPHFCWGQFKQILILKNPTLLTNQSTWQESIYAQENWKPKSPQNPAHRCSQQGHSQQPRAEISQTPVDWRPTHQWSSCTMECYSAIKRHKPLAYLPARTHLWLITRRARSPRKAPVTRFHSEWSSLHWWEGSSEDSGVTWVSQGGVWGTRLPVRMCQHHGFKLMVYPFRCTEIRAQNCKQMFISN